MMQLFAIIMDQLTFIVFVKVKMKQKQMQFLSTEQIELKNASKEKNTQTILKDLNMKKVAAKQPPLLLFTYI